MESSVASARRKPGNAPRQNGAVQRLKDVFHRIDDREFKRVSKTSLRGVPVLLLLIACGMMIFGWVMILSASSVEMIAQKDSPFTQVIRQVIFGVMGLAAMIAIIFIPVRLYRNKLFLHSAMIIAILAQLAVLLIGKEVNGNRNWIVIGSIQIQPSELAKVVTILWMALVLKNQGDVSVGVRRVLFPLAFGLVPLLTLILAGHDVGTVLVYGAFIFVMVWVSGLNRRASILFAILGVLVAVGAMMSTANRRSRIFALLGICDGSVCDQSNSGLAALASGGFWGVGLGRSRQKYNYLPEAHNDYIFAVIGEELGLVGGILIILFYLGLIYCAVRIIARSADRFIKLATTGILTWLVFQALVNVMMVTGLAPVIGVPLPFISYGGSSLISSMVAAGLLIAFARQTPLQSIAGGMDAMVTENPQSRDIARRMPLSYVVNAENAEFRRKNWEPEFDIKNGLKILNFFGIGVTPSETTQPKRPSATRRKRQATQQSQPQRRRPAQQQPGNRQKVQPISAETVEKLQTAVPQKQDGEAPAKIQTHAKTQPALRLVEEPADIGGEHPAAKKTVEAQQQAPQTETTKRKLPAGLAPVKQIRARQKQERNSK